METTMKIAYGYVRVSGDSQVDGDGFTRQCEKICAAAEQHGYLVTAVYYDGGVSGTCEAADRPALSALLAEMALDDCPAAAIVVENSTRLARDTFVEEMILRKCVDAGFLVFGADNWTDLTVSGASNPTALFTRKLLGAYAEFEKNMLVQRLRTARERIREQYGRCEGQKGYGERKGERAIVETIIDLRDSCGLAWNAIAKRLTKCGIPTPQSGKAWSHHSVRLIYERTRREQQNGVKRYSAAEQQRRKKIGSATRRNAIARRTAQNFGSTSGEQGSTTSRPQR